MAGSWLEHWEVLTQTCIFLGTRSGMVSTHACHEPSDGRRRKRAKWNEKPSRETWKHNATGVHFVTTTVRTQRAGKPRKSDYLTPCTLSEFLPALSLFLACSQIMESSFFSGTTGRCSNSCGPHSFVVSFDMVSSSLSFKDFCVCFSLQMTEQRK